jgi:hypothetical protein
MGRASFQPGENPEPDLVHVAPGQPHLSQQAAWTAHGPENLSIEACERLKEEETPYIRDALLKERAAYWRAQLGAEAI